MSKNTDRFEAARNYFLGGLDALDRKEYQIASALFLKSLNLVPDRISTLINLSIAKLRDNKITEALAHIERAVKISPEDVLVLNQYSAVLLAQGKAEQALIQIEKSLNQNCLSLDVHLHHAQALALLQKFEEAIISFDCAISIEPTMAEGYLGKAILFDKLNQFEKSLSCYEKCLKIDPHLIQAQIGYASACLNLQRYKDALEKFQKITDHNQKSYTGWLGVACANEGLAHYEEAYAALKKVTQINSNSERGWLNLGRICSYLNRQEEALSAYDNALNINLNSFEALLGKGNVLFDMKDFNKAIEAYSKIVSESDDISGASLGLGNIYFELQRPEEAEYHYKKALTKNSRMHGALIGLGYLWFTQKKYEDASATFSESLEIDPNYPNIFSAYLLTKLHQCDWKNIQLEINQLARDLESKKKFGNPFSLLSMIDNPALHLHCAREWANLKHKALNQLTINVKNKFSKIQIGYVSADFHNHATGALIAEIIELHDRSHFNVTAYSLGPDDNSVMRNRLANSFDNFIDARGFSDNKLASIILKNEVDILIDLKGYTQNARPNIFALKPAPIQVNYLGYPGSLGANYYDYIIGDNVIFKIGDETFYSEKLVRMPHSYQPNDRQRKISEKCFKRSDMSLPENSFVYCCFNNNYKITPTMFNNWMKILHSVERSVLWLLVDHPSARENLHQEGKSFGIDPSRIIFASHLPPEEHLSRYALADLFLDTLPYNAHTTASDALWAGLPVLTLQGTSFAARVAASLLTAAGLPELITNSNEDYISLAVLLGSNPTKLNEITTKLKQNRASCPLFNSQLYTRHLEAAYIKMYERHILQLPPTSISVDP